MACCGFGKSQKLKTELFFAEGKGERRRSITAGSADLAPEKLKSKEIGFASAHGWAPKGGGFMSKAVTKPKINQDRIFITPKLSGINDAWLFGVYDGNGPKGEVVAALAGAEMVKVIEESTGGAQLGNKLANKDGAALFEDSFSKVNKAIVGNDYAQRSGSTASVVLLHGKTAYVANVGDSKVVRAANGDSWTASSVTSSHKPNMPSEKARIEGKGGYVLDDDASYGAARIFDNPDPVGQMLKLHEQIAKAGSGGGGLTGGVGSLSIAVGDIQEPWPGLAMSRVIGHTGVDKLGVTCEPSVTKFEIGADDRCIILASDGVWDFVSEQEACNIVKQYAPDSHAACQALVDTATQRWIQDDPEYRDDISAIVILTPLETSGLSTETVTFTVDNPVAVADAKAAEAALRRPSAVGMSMGGFGVGLMMAAATTEDHQSTGAAPIKPAQVSTAAKIETTKQQRRGSVITSFGGPKFTPKADPVNI